MFSFSGFWQVNPVIKKESVYKNNHEHEQICPIRDPAERLAKVAHGDGVKNAGKDKEKSFQLAVGSWQSNAKW